MLITNTIIGSFRECPLLLSFAKFELRGRELVQGVSEQPYENKTEIGDWHVEVGTGKSCTRIGLVPRFSVWTLFHIIQPQNKTMDLLKFGGGSFLTC